LAPELIEDMAEATARQQNRLMCWTIAEVVGATGARTNASPLLTFDGVTIDSRRVSPQCLFVALQGQHHDGHSFAHQALERGAAAVLVREIPSGVPKDRALVVPDPLRALGDLAAYTRRRSGLKVFAVTGSNGKTTTKEMVASICERADFPAPRSGLLKTAGNENNLIGLPLTLLRMTGEEAVAVLEMGMNAPGEIDRLTEIACPDIGVITNVGPAHLEGLGSVEGVARAKGELFARMRAEATIVVNMEDEWVPKLAAPFPGRRIEFGFGREVEAQAVRDFGLDGVAFDLHVVDRAETVRLRMPGLHNVSNALAAAAAAHGLGVAIDVIAAGLCAAKAPAMRMQVVRFANGTTVLNDGYNANPASMAAALQTLAAFGSHGIAVLGEMRELGRDSEKLHRQMGVLAARSGIRALVALGPTPATSEMARGAREAGMEIGAIHVCAEPSEVAKIVTEIWRSGDVILLKGSRGADTEKAVQSSGSRMGEVVRLLEEAGGRRP
jgi:UDP-N-acetylmuramoyl-tripeptide--D-alanyl-D-alanine ligase